MYHCLTPENLKNIYFKKSSIQRIMRYFFKLLWSKVIFSFNKRNWILSNYILALTKNFSLRDLTSVCLFYAVSFMTKKSNNREVHRIWQKETLSEIYKGNNSAISLHDEIYISIFLTRYYLVFVCFNQFSQLRKFLGTLNLQVK